MGWEERLRSARARALTRAPLQATCKRFWEFCAQRGVELAPAAFNMGYETCIPRQAGLSGSSAIVCAALSCLLDFYGVAEQCVSAGTACLGPGSGYTCFTLCVSCLSCMLVLLSTMASRISHRWHQGNDQRPLLYLCHAGKTPAGTAARLAVEVHNAHRAELGTPVPGSRRCSGPRWC